MILLLLKALITLSRTIDSCVSDVKEVWVVQNKLHLKDNKTEILLTGSAPGTDLPPSIISDVKGGVVQNKLKLNDDKTGTLPVGSAPGIDLPPSITKRCDS